MASNFVQPLRFRAEKPCANVRFIDENDEEVGCIGWGSGEIVFTGNVAESARIFFETCLEPFMVAMNANG